MPFSFPRPLTACRRVSSLLRDAFAPPTSHIPGPRLEMAIKSGKSPAPETPTPQQPAEPVASTLRQHAGPSLENLDPYPEFSTDGCNQAARRTLARLGYEWRGGEEWKPPLGSPPPYITGEDNREAIWAESSASKILTELGYRYVRVGDYGRWTRPASNSDAGEALADLELDRRRRRLSKSDLDRADAACATLVQLGYGWLGGDRWKPSLGAKNASNRLDALVSASQHSQAVATLRRLGWRFMAGQWVEAPPGPSIAEPPPTAFVSPPNEAHMVERIAGVLGVPAAVFYKQGGPKPEPAPPQKSNVATALERIARALELQTEDLLKPLPGPGPRVADDLRDAIDYALQNKENNGIGWLEAWWEGDEKAAQEFETWRAE